MLEINMKIKRSLNFKMDKVHKQTIQKERKFYMSSKYMKTRSPSLIIKDMHNEIKMKYHFQWLNGQIGTN